MATFVIGRILKPRPRQRKKLSASQITALESYLLERIAYSDKLLALLNLQGDLNEANNASFKESSSTSS